MPTYNYYCGDCDTHFSYFQKMSESPISNCENCGGKINRLITGGKGLIFKGSGFYLTDYKNDQKPSKDSTNPTQKKNENSSQKCTTGVGIKMRRRPGGARVYYCTPPKWGPGPGP